MNINPGDHVVCIDATGTRLTTNTIYKVWAVLKDGKYIALTLGGGVYYPSDIFIRCPVIPFKGQPPEEIPLSETAITSSAELVITPAELVTPKMTLPTDSKTRKEYPMMMGCIRYFPAALAGVSNTSKRGNDKHNLGEELHHARGKSMDHGDCILRHLIDVQDLLAAMDRGENKTPAQVLEEVNQMAWRALAYSQELHERFGAPMAPGAKK